MSNRLAEANDPDPLVVRPKAAWKMLACGNTRGYELLAAGELNLTRMGVLAKSR